MTLAETTSGIRSPAVASSFYPSDARELAQVVTRLLDATSVEPRTETCGIIAPHAGYIYSGPVAAEAFATLGPMTERFRRAVIIGPSHFVYFHGIAAPSQTAFATPLGLVPVETETIGALVEENLVVIDDAPHGPDHAIEVELPLLQAIFGEIPIVPLLFGAASAAAVAAVVARLWTRETLMIVSSDLSHFEPYRSACAHDSRTAAAIEAFDEAAIGPDDACGHLAIRGLLAESARRGLGIDRLDLRNSGDTAGDRARVVGYGAWALLDAA